MYIPFINRHVHHCYCYYCKYSVAADSDGGGSGGSGGSGGNGGVGGGVPAATALVVTSTYLHVGTVCIVCIVQYLACM